MAHILLLTDRDWTHPQGGGTGANLYGQVAHWIEWGHRVTVVAGTYPGAAAVEQPAPGLELHHMGTRTTVFPRAAWSVRRGLACDADVVLEVVNGITFLTPLWLRRPRVTLVHHIHRDHYATELGRKGALAAVFAETLPLKLLYGGAPFLTISESAKSDIVALGVPEEDVRVGYLGVAPFPGPLPPESEPPRLLYLGRLKRYKRIELLLDVVEGIPGAVLDIAGEGDHRPALEAEIAARGLGERVTLHGHVAEEEKAALYSRAWVNLTASSAEGWCLTVMEAATCGTPSAALRIGGLPESIVDGETGLLADDGPGLTAAVRSMVDDRELRERLGAAARERAATFTWERTARETLEVLEAARERGRVSLRTVLARSETLKAAGMAAATMANNFIALIFTVLFARLLGAEDYGSLAALISLFVILAVPGSAVQVAVAREIALGRLGEGERLSATLTIWRRRLLVVGAAVTAIAVAAARAVRGPHLRPGGVGRGGHGADRRSLAAAVRGARCAAGRARLQAGRLVARAGGDGTPVLRDRARGARPRRDRRLPRHATVDAGDSAGAVVDQPCALRPPGPGCGGAAADRPHRRRMARGARAVPHRGAAERRRDHGQAPDRR